jgi:hypothetical protein
MTGKLTEMQSNIDAKVRRHTTEQRFSNNMTDAKQQVVEGR